MPHEEIVMQAIICPICRMEVSGDAFVEHYYANIGSGRLINNRIYLFWTIKV